MWNIFAPRRQERIIFSDCTSTAQVWTKSELVVGAIDSIFFASTEAITYYNALSKIIQSE
ncbi:MAG TPA: hypothetical protein DEH02_19050 [Bacteroidales bacterium]|nr:MAG: hypothetical protein A2X01_07150 [Bacteroidetes bacterium GWF2_35_48]HBX53162.1 hypothetical protein [Bacteroidales bacterium]